MFNVRKCFRYARERVRVRERERGRESKIESER